jgi:hypothetical protein
MGTHRFGPALVILAVALAGCSTPAGTGQSPPGTSTVHSQPPAVATMQDNGHTLTLTVGQPLSVRLDSTYWTFAPTGVSLRRNGEPVVNSGGPCVPGQGCGTVTAQFVADTPGQAVVSASRVSCGEAMRCTGPAGQYRLTVVVH